MTTVSAAPVLNEAQLHSLFPFHLSFDRNLTATSVGSSLRKICSRLATGQPIAGAIEIERPKLKLDFDSIAQSTGLLFLIRVGDNALML